MSNEIEKWNEAFLIYQDENGIARVNVRFEGEDVWLLSPPKNGAFYESGLIGHLICFHRPTNPV